MAKFPSRLQRAFSSWPVRQRGKSPLPIDHGLLLPTLNLVSALAHLVATPPPVAGSSHLATTPPPVPGATHPAATPPPRPAYAHPAATTSPEAIASHPGATDLTGLGCADTLSPVALPPVMSTPEPPFPHLS